MSPLLQLGKEIYNVYCKQKVSYKYLHNTFLGAVKYVYCLKRFNTVPDLYIVTMCGLRCTLPKLNESNNSFTSYKPIKRMQTLKHVIER